ncbi:MAG: hypothetical protein WCL60_16340 [Methylococcales bacterium]|jgi:hypothetical protein
MRILNLLSLILALLFITTGCATFREDGRATLSKWPPDAPVNKNTIALQVSGNWISNDEQQDVNVDLLENWRKEVFRAYETSGLFSAVKSGTEKSDIYADVKITDKGDFSMFMTILSHIIPIPRKTHDCLIFNTTYKDKNGRLLSTVSKTECVNTWFSVFLFPAMFSNFPETVAKDVLFDLNRSSILEANSKATFNTVSRGEP